MKQTKTAHVQFYLVMCGDYEDIKDVDINFTSKTALLKEIRKIKKELSKIGVDRFKYDESGNRIGCDVIDYSYIILD